LHYDVAFLREVLLHGVSNILELVVVQLAEEEMALYRCDRASMVR
jgi:hypothetical protein